MVWMGLYCVVSRCKGGAPVGVVGDLVYSIYIQHIIKCVSVVSRVLLNCREESLNVSVPMRMLEVFSSQRTYLPALGDADSVASLLEQILHSMVQKGKGDRDHDR